MSARNEPIEVETDDEGTPVTITRRGKTYTVHAVSDHYRSGGAWWRGEPDRDVWQLVVNTLRAWTISQAIDEEGRPAADPDWQIEQIFD